MDRGEGQQADDTCNFMTTANDIPPNIVILLDNGASMEEIVWHSRYDNSVDYTPNSVPQADIVQNSVSNGFYRKNGYSVKKSGNDYYLEIPDNLIVADSQYSRKADGTGNLPTWTIDGKTITLPAIPSKTSVDGVIDNATNFRFSKNYLHYLFYGAYPGNESDLPNKARFYFAKKALMTIAKMAANKASLSIYNFTANATGASNVQPLGLVVNTPVAPNPEDNTLNSSYVNNINNMGTETMPIESTIDSRCGMTCCLPIPTTSQRNALSLTTVKACIASKTERPANEGSRRRPSGLNRMTR